MSEQIPNSEFLEYFSEIYGTRWDEISRKLQVKEKQVYRMNSWAPVRLGEDFLAAKSSPLENLENCFWTGEAREIPRHENGLLGYYIMDPASVIGARFARFGAGGKILDLCAAPGGKSLILIEGSLAEGGSSEIWLNEMSSSRRERLKKVVQQYVPNEIRQQVWVKGQDGIQVGMKFPKLFGTILVDAPCSGERHLLENPEELRSWKVSRSKKYAQRQFALISSAYLGLVPGGHLIYSTCSMNPVENDAVVERLLDRHDDLTLDPRITEVREDELLYGEKTEFGIQFLPDRCGFGPFYFSGLVRSE